MVTMYDGRWQEIYNINIHTTITIMMWQKKNNDVFSARNWSVQTVQPTQAK